jgi:hypothetical protein
MVRPEVQRQLFETALEYIEGRTNLIDRIIEVDLRDEIVTIQEFG